MPVVVVVVMVPLALLIHQGVAAQPLSQIMIRTFDATWQVCQRMTRVGANHGTLFTVATRRSLSIFPLRICGVFMLELMLCLDEKSANLLGFHEDCVGHLKISGSPMIAMLGRRHTWLDDWTLPLSFNLIEFKLIPGSSLFIVTLEASPALDYCQQT